MSEQDYHGAVDDMMAERDAELETADESLELEDFDAFWSTRKRKTKRTKIMGRVVELPPSLPLQFELEARRLQQSKDERDMRKLLAILFGEDAMEQWAEAGMDAEQLAVLLAWAPQAIMLGDKAPSIAQVAEQLDAADTAGPTKRPRRKS